MESIRKFDEGAAFRFFGGDLMQKVGGQRVRHYEELAYMGFIPVLLHLPTIIKNMNLCKQDIVKWQPDVVILVDYPGFNLKIAKYVHKNTKIPVYYYISPKIWAWKEWRIRAIKRDVREMFSILPFEIDFYERKHNYKIHYVGNPTAEEVATFKAQYTESKDEFCSRNGLNNKPIIAILSGSRKQEIKDNLPAMLEAGSRFEDYQLVIAGAPSIDDKFYEKYIADKDVKIVKNETYQLLSHTTNAIVTSGTATLETALFNVPQVVCYKTPLPNLIRFAFNHIIKVKYISLVNLIANKEVVQELMAERFRINNIVNEVYKLLPNKPARQTMLDDYKTMQEKLGDYCAPDNAAISIVHLLKNE